MKKIRNNITKSLALFLIATLLFVGLPTQGLILNANADTEANPQVSVSEMDSITYTEDNDVYILAEDVSKRGEFEKHYLCSDGNFIAVAYPEAIHRLDENGQWVDLDFSLVLNTSANAYESQNGDFRVAFCSGISATSDASVMSSSVTQTQNTDLISLRNGIYSLSWGLYANMAMTSPISSSAMQSSGISSTSETASLPATLNTIQINGNVAGVEPTAAISDTENKSIYDTDTFDLSKVSNSVEYHSVFGADEGISLRYTVSYNKIEEDIILTKATNVTSFSLSVDADGLVPMLNQDNSVDFLDENGDMVYHIGIPYMVDAAFAVLNDIQVTVNTDSANTNGRWLITYTPNNEWLQAEERVYPIMLDPSITTNEYQSYIEDTYVEENSTVDHSDEQYLYITKNGNNRREAVVRITKLPTIEASMPIVSATLHMVAQYGPFSTLSMKSVYGATFWDISECAYGDSVFMDEPITSTGLLSASDTGLTFDISNCISRMYDDEQEAQASGSPYYGDFIIGFYDADDSNFCYPFLSTEYATVSSRPTFTVKYGYTLPADMEEGEVFSFESVYSYSFMTVNGINPANNSNIYQVDNGNEIAITTQQFKLERVSSTGGYLLRSMSSSNGTDKVVSVQRGSSSVSSGQNVCLASATDALAQEWFIVPVDYNEYRIVPRANMSLALTVYGIADGSNSGRTTTSEGNIFVQTLNTNSYQQLWYIYDSENHAVETDDCRSTLETDEYYITNKYVGKYLHRTGNTVDCKQGTINDLNAQEETIKWKIVNLGDGYCTIQRYDRPGLYMVPESTSSGSSITFRSTSDTSLPDKFKWSIRIVTGGGCLIQNKESKLYLYAFEQSANPSLVRSYGLYSAGSVGYEKQIWRFVASDDYVEWGYDNASSIYDDLIEDMVINIGESKTPSVNQKPLNAFWGSYTDFTYSLMPNQSDQSTLPTEIISINTDCSISAHKAGVVQVQAVHKVSGITVRFDVIVDRYTYQLIDLFHFSKSDAVLIRSCYDLMKTAYPNDSDIVIAWKYSRLMGGFIYGDTDSLVDTVWKDVAGSLLLENQTLEEYFFNLGIDHERFESIKVSVQQQHMDCIDRLYTGDFSHFQITLATHLAYHLNQTGLATSVASIYVGEDIPYLAGWLGDAVLCESDGTTSFGNDDYIADLDAENIYRLLITGNYDYISATNSYYESMMHGTTRANIFKTYLPYSTIQQKVFDYLIDNQLRLEILLWEEQRPALADDPIIESMISYYNYLLNDEAYHHQIIQDQYPDTYHFLLSVEQGYSYIH